MRILWTPPDPRMCIYLFTLLFVGVQGWAQDNNVLAGDEEVRTAIESKYDSLAEREIFDEKRIKRYRFLNFLPTPGYSLLQGPTVSYDLSSVLRFMEAKERHRVDKERIINGYRQKAEEEYEDYLLMREQVEALRDELEVQDQILELERKLFGIAEEKYQNHEITPTQYFQEEIGFRQKELSYQKKQERLRRSERRLQAYYQQRRIYYADSN